MQRILDSLKSTEGRTQLKSATGTGLLLTKKAFMSECDV